MSLAPTREPVKEPPSAARTRRRTIVYIDGFNLYYGCLKGTPYKWLDLCHLSELLLPRHEIVGVNYYTARVSGRPGNESAPLHQQVYLRALRTLPRVAVTYGQFRTRSVHMTLTGVMPLQYVWVDKTEEKGSDVNLATHLVRDACQGRFEVAVVISNDSDLVEPVRVVRLELGLPVGLVSPRQHHTAGLASVATFTRRIRQSDLVTAQFPPVLRDAKGEFHKPPSW